MKIYVPEFQHFLPQVGPDNLHILADILVEIDHRDLKTAIMQWAHSPNYAKQTPRYALWQSVKDICEHPVKNGSIESKPWLLRPALTVHCGSMEGNEYCKEIFLPNMREVGRLAARNGFNLWYGGGDDANMGETLKGFNEQLKSHRFEHQYSVQVVPGSFVLGVDKVVSKKNYSGRRPANEGLGTLSDIAIVLPEFSTRYNLLNNICTAAVTGPGDFGTRHEALGIIVNNKTGLGNTPLYIMNLFVPQYGQGFYDNFLKDFEMTVKCGLGVDQRNKCYNVVELPEQIMPGLMKTLNETGRNPHEIYNKHRAAFAPQQPLFVLEKKGHRRGPSTTYFPANDRLS